MSVFKCLLWASRCERSFERWRVRGAIFQRIATVMGAEPARAFRRTDLCSTNVPAMASMMQPDMMPSSMHLNRSMGSGIKSTGPMQVIQGGGGVSRSGSPACCLSACNAQAGAPLGAGRAEALRFSRIRAWGKPSRPKQSRGRPREGATTCLCLSRRQVPGGRIPRKSGPEELTIPCLLQTKQTEQTEETRQTRCTEQTNAPRERSGAFSLEETRWFV